MEISTQFPIHPKRRRVMPRKWDQEPEVRSIASINYRTSRYGGPTPPTSMVRNMREQEVYRRVGSPPQ